jgi:hypothetical protein
MEVLSPPELESLLGILSVDGLPLEQVAGDFHRAFTRNDYFKVGCAVSMLLTDQLLTRSQVSSLLPHALLLTAHKSHTILFAPTVALGGILSPVRIIPKRVKWGEPIFVFFHRGS